MADKETKEARTGTLRVSVTTARNIKHEELWVKFKYGNTTTRTSTTKKGHALQWGETHTFPLQPAEEPLKLEVNKKTLFGHTTVGEVTVPVELKEKQDWYPIVDKKGASIGEIQIGLTPPVKKQGALALAAATLALTDETGLELLKSSEDYTSNFHSENELSQIKPGQAVVVTSVSKFGLMSFVDVDTEDNFRFALRFKPESEEYAGTLCDIILPRNFQPAQEYKQSRNVGLRVYNPESLSTVNLDRSCIVTIQVHLRDVEGQPSVYSFKFDGKAIDRVASKMVSFKGVASIHDTVLHAKLEANPPDSFVRTPVDISSQFFQGCSEGDLDAVREYLARGEDVNKAFPPDNDTGLHKAVMKGHVDVVRLLVGYGADPKLQNKYKETPSDIAEKVNNKTLISIIRRYW